MGSWLIWAVESNRAKADQVQLTVRTVDKTARLVKDLQTTSAVDLAGRASQYEARWSALRGELKDPRQQEVTGRPVEGLIEQTDAVLRKAATAGQATAAAAETGAQEVAADAQLLWARWHQVQGALNARLLLALSGPPEKWLAAALLSILGCLAAICLLLQQRRVRLEGRRARALEAELRKSDAASRQMLEAADSALFRLSPDGIVLAVNSRFQELTGVSGEMPWAALLKKAHDWDRLLVRLEQGENIRGEQLVLKESPGDSPVRAVLVNLTPDRDAATGRLRSINGSMHDITALKQTEQELQVSLDKVERENTAIRQQAKELLDQSFDLAEGRDRALKTAELRGAYLARLSQDLRLPVDGMLRMSSLLASAGSMPAQQRELALAVRQSAELVLHELDEILGYVAIENGEMQLVREPFSIRELIEEIAEQWAETVERKGLELPCLVTADVPEVVSGDLRRIRQVLGALVQNAVNLTSSGEVAITVSLAQIQNNTAHVRFQVEDTGAGFAVDRAFEPYAIGRGTPGIAGSMPLAVAKRLVERMGGQIGAESEPGQGSLLWILLPVTVQSLQDPRQHSLRQLLQGRKALVVDDVASARGVIAQQLAAWGMKTATTADGNHALELIQEAAHSGTPFDVALVDYELPGLSGLELAEAILDDPALTTGVVLVIPNSQRQWRDEPMLEGLRGVLTKPVRGSELAAALSACFGQPSRPSPASAPPAIETALTRLEEALGRAGHSAGGPPSAAPGDAPVVLIAEDNVVNQKVAVRLVEKMGYQAEVVTNGREAVDAVSKKSYVLILMDCQMPEMDGFSAAGEIRKLQEGSRVRTPIIAMTANAMKGDREKCLAAGMDDYISKPVAFENLRSLVWRHIAAAAMKPLAAGASSSF